MLTPGRRERWLVSYCTRRKTGRRSDEIRHGAFVLTAFSRQEADGLARERVGRQYPEAEGWSPPSTVISNLEAQLLEV